MKKYLRIPIYFWFVWVVLTFVTFRFDVIAGTCMAVVSVIYIALALFIYLRFEPTYTKNLVEFGAEYNQIQKQMLNELDVPFGLTSSLTRVVAMNL